MTPRGYAAYRSVAVNTVQSKEKILLMVYEGLVKYVQVAHDGIRLRDPRMKGEAISKVIAIISELDCALDREVGGTLADNLSSLYQWIMATLTKANLNNDLRSLEDVQAVLKTLQEGFGEAMQQHTELTMPTQEQTGLSTEVQGGLSFAV